MIRRSLPVLALGTFALGLVTLLGVGAAQPGSLPSLLIAAVAASAIAVATTRMLSSTVSETQPVRAARARDVWLGATIAQSPTHTDARALMRPRPPSVAR